MLHYSKAVPAALAGITAVTLALTAPAAAQPLRADGVVVPVQLGGDGYATEGFVYVPNVEELGERATATPLLIVYPDHDVNANSARVQAEKSGLAEIAAAEKGVVLFINSSGDDWSEADERSLPLAQDLFSDSSANDYTAGELAGQSADGHFPGTRFRTYVFGDRSGADFINSYLVDGVPDTHPFVSAWSATLYPSAVFVSNPRTSVNLGSEGAEVPAFVVNGSEGIVSSYEAINSRVGEVGTASAPRRSGFDPTTVLEGYDEVVDSFYRRDSWQAPYVSELAPVPQWDEIGVDVTRTITDIAGNEVEYFTYVPDSVADAAPGSVPLVMLYHGGRNHAEWQAIATEWPVLGARDGFIVVAVQDHPDLGFGTDASAAVVDHVIAENQAVDTERVYASGFSLGASQTWSLGLRHSSTFAGIAPTNGAFFGTTQPPQPVDDLQMPTFYAAGPSSPFAEFPSRGGTPNTVDQTLAMILAKNDVTENYVFDAADDPSWGIAPDRTATYESTYVSVASVVKYYENTDGDELVALANNLASTHEPLEVTSRAAWDFLQQFSRNSSDGSIEID